MSALTASRHTTLVSLIKLANLTSLFTDPANQYTIFAPSERYFLNDVRNLGLSVDQLKNDIPLLTSILAYHVVPGIHLRSEFFNERLFRTVNGQVLRTNHYLANNRFYVDGSLLSNTAIQTTNGVIHTVQHVLNPIKGNVYDTIAQDPDMKTLTAAIDATGLDTFLRDQAPITIFAPNDDAFALLGNTVQTLLGQPELLKEILTYHVIPGSLYRGGMHDSTLHTFEEADRLTLDNHVYGADIDDARFRKYDISATNGVIHKISKVLVPDSLKGKI